MNGKRTPEYDTWRRIKNRCYNANDPAYPRYGGRGIKVCARWLRFRNFLADMGARPSSAHSLDRFPDNDGDYRPGNCRWATDAQQNQNKRSNIVVIDADGSRLVLKEFARRHGVPYGTVYRRFRSGRPLL